MKTSEVATTNTLSKGKRRLAELRSMYKEATQIESECMEDITGNTVAL